MISLFSNGNYYQYFYHKETSTYLFLQKNQDKCAEGNCSLGEVSGYNEDCWEDFEEYWTPQELIEFVERHMKHD